ncbi:hypothetical protein WMZ97_05485 [Lentibacillus sp. N15]|uniref:IS1096 element passenger TnpR family protein n=1 Tax=Lentibacillus songyuanensis TaxID=3136161 RepID=UPI0031BB7A6C
MSATHTMEDLHHTILQAFQFNDDHLYSFFMDGKKWSHNCIVSPLDDGGGQNAASITIGSIGMHPRKRFLYLYDYGDEWIFTITVDHIQDDEPGPVKPYIAERKGDAPVQYY